MCGIVGILCDRPEPDLAGRLAAMSRTLLHRGPDQQGTRTTSRLALGMTRLAIVDKTHHDLPYTNEDDTVWLAYNGEIYNHRAIRDALTEVHQFRTRSDSETIVHAYEERGLDMLADFNGMYAFALVDHRAGRLFLVRDKIGEKPLYYCHSNGRLIFASEIKAILTQVEPKADLSCLSYQAFEFCCGRETLFEGIHSLLPGEYLEVSLDDPSDIRRVRYWQVTDHLVEVPDDEACVERDLTELLEDAVRLRTGNSAYGFGCLVSGGVDSALLAALAKPDYLYTCTYNMGPAYDELDYANMLAKHLDRELVVVRPTREEFEAFHADIVYALDLPCTWTSFNLFCILERVREDCRVTLTGEGIDELFGGYHRYLLLHHDEQIHRMEALSEYGYLIDRYYGSAVERYARLINRCERPHDADVNRYLNDLIAPCFEAFRDVVHGMGLVDMQTTMQVLLHMADRMNMTYSMENRSPFLDPRLVSYAFSMPSRFKIHNGVTKWMIKRIARKFIPAPIAERTDKRGFLAPLNVWFGWSDAGKYDRAAYRRLCLEDWRSMFFNNTTKRRRSASPCPLSLTAST